MERIMKLLEFCGKTEEEDAKKVAEALSLVMKAMDNNEAVERAKKTLVYLKKITRSSDVIQMLENFIADARTGKINVQPLM